jgi:large subunit ribosomal protein L20
MSRVKGGPKSRRRHKKLLAQTKGHHGVRNRLYRRASESRLHALSYAYRDRRDRKADFRRLWIQRINAAARLNGLSYSTLIHGLRISNIEVDRKILADIAVNDIASFNAIADRAKVALSNN